MLKKEHAPDEISDITPNMATNADQNVQPIMICEDVGSLEDPLIHYW